MAFDFDRPIDRTGTHSVKYDGRLATFGDADVMPLWVADMDFATAPCVTDAVAARAEHPLYGYTIAPDSLYQSIIDWHEREYGWRIRREWIVLSPGTLPGLSATLEALTEPGDAVVIQPPVYPPFSTIPNASGRRVVTNPLVERDGYYRMDLDHLERCAANGARMLILCSPHNPVGRVWGQSELEAVLAIARRHDVTVVSDDIHSGLTYDDADFVPLGSLARPGDSVVSILSPTKTFNIQSLSLSALIVPSPVRRKAVSRVLGARVLGNFNAFSLVAAEAAWAKGRPWRDALLAYLQQTCDEAVDYVRRYLAPIRVTPPEAGYLMWLDCRELGMDDRALERFFIRDCGLGLNPGISFGEGGSGFMRLNFAAPRERIMTALEAVRAGLSTQSLYRPCVR